MNEAAAYWTIKHKLQDHQGDKVLYIPARGDDPRWESRINKIKGELGLRTEDKNTFKCFAVPGDTPERPNPEDEIEIKVSPPPIAKWSLGWKTHEERTVYSVAEYLAATTDPPHVQRVVRKLIKTCIEACDHARERGKLLRYFEWDAFVLCTSNERNEPEVEVLYAHIFYSCQRPENPSPEFDDSLRPREDLKFKPQDDHETSWGFRVAEDDYRAAKKLIEEALTKLTADQKASLEPDLRELRAKAGERDGEHTAPERFNDDAGNPSKAIEDNQEKEGTTPPELGQREFHVNAQRIAYGIAMAGTAAALLVLLRLVQLPVQERSQELTIREGLSVTSKEYDGNKDATVIIGKTLKFDPDLPELANYTLGNVTAHFETAHAETNKNVILGDLYLVDKDLRRATNFQINKPKLKAFISKRELAPELTIEDLSKPYDGDATKFIPKVRVSRVVEADENRINVSASLKFEAEKPGTNVNVRVDYNLSGKGSSNYQFRTASSSYTNGQIKDRQRMVSPVHSQPPPPFELAPYLEVLDKTYDGETGATARIKPDRKTDLASRLGNTQLKPDDQWTVSFSNADVGTQTVTIHGIELRGANPADLKLKEPVSVSGRIVQKQIPATNLLNPGALTMEYNGTRKQTVTNVLTTHLLKADRSRPISATLEYETNSAGSNIPVTIGFSGISDNYAITETNQMGAISKKTLNLSFRPQKLFDQSTKFTNAVSRDVLLRAGLVKGDQLDVDINGNFANPDVGDSLQVINHSFLASGSSAGNYAIVLKLEPGRIEAPDRAPPTTAQGTPGGIRPLGRPEVPRSTDKVDDAPLYSRLQDFADNLERDKGGLSKRGKLERGRDTKFGNLLEELHRMCKGPNEQRRLKSLADDHTSDKFVSTLAAALRREDVKEVNYEIGQAISRSGGWDDVIKALQKILGEVTKD